jgi:hypothetical protein
MCAHSGGAWREHALFTSISPPRRADSPSRESYSARSSCANEPAQSWQPRPARRRRPRRRRRLTGDKDSIRRAVAWWIAFTSSSSSSVSFSPAVLRGHRADERAVAVAPAPLREPLHEDLVHAPPQLVVAGLQLPLRLLDLLVQQACIGNAAVSGAAGPHLDHVRVCAQLVQCEVEIGQLALQLPNLHRHPQPRDKRVRDSPPGN